MGDPQIYRLPVEILTRVIQLSFEHPESGNAPHKILVPLARTSRRFYSFIFHESNDHIWKLAAINLGLPAELTLADVKYSGTNHLQKRTWLQLYKCIASWEKPFPPVEELLPLKWAQKDSAEYAIPPRAEGENGTEKVERVMEVFCSSIDSRTGKRLYLAKQPERQDGGKVYFQTVAEDGDAATCNVMEKCEGGLEASRTVATSDYPNALLCQPTFENLIVQKKGLDYTIKRVNDSLPGGLEELGWNLEQRKPHRYESYGNVLVAITFPLANKPGVTAPSSVNTHIPSNLVCLERTANGTVVRWEYDITQEWKSSKESIQFPLGRSFHITSTVLAYIITRHPDATDTRLHRTEFVIVSLATGAVIRTLKFPPTVRLVLGMSSVPRPAWTSAFSHDFILTDTHIVSGGPGGALFVWSYHTRKTPQYVLPDTHVLGGGDLRPYTNITLSVDGRLVAAVASDHLMVWDMFTKKVLGRWDNGRKDLAGSGIHVVDTPGQRPKVFPNGIWGMWRDWERKDTDKGETWAPTGKINVVYLSESPVEDARILAKQRRAAWKFWKRAKVGLSRNPAGSMVLFVLVLLLAIVLGRLLQ